MLDVREALVDITNEEWVVKKMRLEYTNIIAIILPIIYQKCKVQYFNNKYAMMISKVDHGESINWATIMYYPLVKELSNGKILVAIRFGDLKHSVIIPCGNSNYF
jgi:hypothetical protein